MISHLFPPGIRKPWFILTGAAFGIVVLSFIRFAYTGVLTTDFIKFQDEASYLAGFGFIALLGIFGYGYYRVVMNDEGWTMNRREVMVLSLWITLLTAPMLPLLSNDIFSVLAYGDLILKGISPYDYGYYLQQSDFFGYVAPWWKNAPCAYGPVSAAISLAAVAIGGTHDLIVPIMAYKALNTVFVIIFILVISKMDGVALSRFNTHALLLLSPILWLQGSGQAHNDMIAVAFSAAALLSAMKTRYALAAALAALAFNAKISGLIVCPLLVLLLWDSYKKTPWQFMANALKCIGIFATVTVIVWLPFYNGPQTILEPLAFLHNSVGKNGPIVAGILTLGSMILDILNYIVPFMTWADKNDFLNDLASFTKFVMPVLLFAIVMTNIWKYVWKKSAPDSYITFFAIFGAAFYSLSNNTFHPWYMLIILPFFLYLDDRKWASWVILMGILVNFLDIPILLQRSIFAAFLYKTSLLAVMGLFLWDIRSRYFIQAPMKTNYKHEKKR